MRSQNWASSGTLYLGGTARVTATVKSAVYYDAILYLLGSPALTKSSAYDAHQLDDGRSSTIVANNGKTDSALAYYTGGALDISYPSMIDVDTVLVSGIEDEEQAKKFNITIGDDALESFYDDMAKTITAKGKAYTITYRDRAKADDGAAFSSTHGADYPNQPSNRASGGLS